MRTLPMSILSVITIILLVGCTIGKDRTPVDDAVFIKAMIDSGSNPQKNHLIEYEVRCDESKKLERIEKLVAENGFSVGKIYYSKEYNEWVASYGKESLLTETAIKINKDKISSVLIANGCHKEVYLGADIVE